MNLKPSIAALILIPCVLIACSKQDNAPVSEQTGSSEAVVNSSSQVTPEQQAAIDSIDKPKQDENNTDIPAEIANAPADEATPDAELATLSAE